MHASLQSQSLCYHILIVSHGASIVLYYLWSYKVTARKCRRLNSIGTNEFPPCSLGIIFTRENGHKKINWNQSMFFKIFKIKFCLPAYI